MGIFRKKPFHYVGSDANDRLNLVDELQQETIKSGGSSITVLVKRSVPCRQKVMPTVKQYDLEEMLKAGYKPEQINVHGMLDASDGFNASEAFSNLAKPFEKSADSSESAASQTAADDTKTE